MTTAGASFHSGASHDETHAAALARSARSKLARALAELQAPDAPRPCLEGASVVAAAMGLLHSYDESGDGRLVALALTKVRSSLGMLQSLPGEHAAIGSAASQVAAALGLLHSVGELVNVGRDKAAIPAAKAPSASQTLRLHGIPSPGADVTDTVKHHGRLPETAPARADATPASVDRSQSPSEWAKRRVDPWHPPAQAQGKASVVEAALGTHSHTNFYKGLGDDLFESGGLFVATYDIPPTGQQLRLRVSMPGGYEFLAEGVVRWTREAPSDTSLIPDVSPGFGVQFTRVSPEAKALIHRYVKNREPLFHD